MFYQFVGPLGEHDEELATGLIKREPMPTFSGHFQAHLHRMDYRPAATSPYFHTPPR